MNYSPPIRLTPDNEAIELDRRADAFRPIGSDAPKHSAAWVEYQAAAIAAAEVHGRAIHCPIHRASLDAWRRGERSSPWPDPSPADRAKADVAVRSLIRGFLP